MLNEKTNWHYRIILNSVVLRRYKQIITSTDRILRNVLYVFDFISYLYLYFFQTSKIWKIVSFLIWHITVRFWVGILVVLQITLALKCTARYFFHQRLCRGKLRGIDATIFFENSRNLLTSVFLFNFYDMFEIGEYFVEFLSSFVKSR